MIIEKRYKGIRDEGVREKNYTPCPLSLTPYFICTLLIICLLAMPSFATAPKVQEQVTKEGLKFWAIEDNFLPIISVKIVFTKAGSAYDPEDKLGLANMASELLNEGAGEIKGIEYKKLLEEMASTIVFSVDSNNFYTSVTSLKENLPETMRLFSLALTSPKFSGDSIRRVRRTTLAAIAQQQEKPELLATKIFQEKFFEGHPYSRQEEGTAEGVKSIVKDDLILYAQEKFSRQNMVISVVGDIKPAEISKLLDEHLAKLPEKAKIKEIPKFSGSPNLGQVISIKKDIPQSVAIFGMPGPRRSDEDFYPSFIANHVLGDGGFESRLMDSVREKRGLAYTVYTSLRTYPDTGLISGYVATKSDSMAESLKVINAELEKIHKYGVSPMELEDAKDYLIGSFPLRMTRNSTLASFLSVMQYDELGIDFLEKRNAYITSVGQKPVNAAAAKYLDPHNMLVVVVGN